MNYLNVLSNIRQWYRLKNIPQIVVFEIRVIVQYRDNFKDYFIAYRPFHGIYYRLFYSTSIDYFIGYTVDYYIDYTLD